MWSYYKASLLLSAADAGGFEGSLFCRMNRIAALSDEVVCELSLASCDNSKRRELHAKVEILRLDIEEEAAREAERQADGGARNFSITGVISEEDDRNLNGLVAKLHLVPIRRPFKWWYWLDVVFRFVGVCTGFLTVGVLLSLPVLLLRVIDSLLGSDPFQSRSEWLKRAICRFILILSGVEVHIEGIDCDSFKQSCSLLTFSHASNLDGFLVSLTCPIRHYAFAKKELFYVPFFSWISIAIGGVPVDRDNRDRAVGTLKRISNAAKSSKMCIVIAPEGTRSLTGQLLPFKKGVSHIWEELLAPVIPVVLYGGWDLYPVGSWVNQCGHVAVRYLKPIYPNDVKSRDDLIRLVRFPFNSTAPAFPPSTHPNTHTHIIINPIPVIISSAAACSSRC